MARSDAFPLTSRLSGRTAGLLAVAVVSGCVAGCTARMASLTQLLEARRLVSDLHVEFSKAADAADRAVLADTDLASTGAADEARRARQRAEQDILALAPLLQSLGFQEEQKTLEGFNTRFAEYRRLDDEILLLAVENSNLKAQRLSFGPSQDALDTFRTALDQALRSNGSHDGDRAQALAARALVGVLDIQALQAPHIAEAEDANMTRLEERMAASEVSARHALSELRGTVQPAAQTHVDDAAAALDRFKTTLTEIISLSRRNSEVRSIALSLGDKRRVAAQCDDLLRALDESMAQHAFAATR